MNYSQSYIHMLLHALLPDGSQEGSLFESNPSVGNIFNSLQHKV